MRGRGTPRNRRTRGSSLTRRMWAGRVSLRCGYVVVVMLVRAGGAGEARLGLGFLRGMLGLVVTVVVGAAVAGTGCGASLAAAACTAALVLVVPLLIAVASSGRLLLDAPGTSGSFLRGMERMSFFLGGSMVGRTSAVDWSEWVAVVAAALRASSSTTMRIHPSSRKEGLRVSEIHRKERTRERKRERVDPPPQRPIENDPGGSAGKRVAPVLALRRLGPRHGRS